MKKFYLAITILALAFTSCFSLLDDAEKDFVNTSGEAVWARTVGASDKFTKYNATVAADDGVYAAGATYAASTTIGPITLNGIGDQETAILVKYDKNGEVMWAKNVISNVFSAYFGIAIGKDGIYACGYIRTTATGSASFNFGNNVIKTAETKGKNIIIIVKYNFNGDALWAQTLINTNIDSTSELFTISTGVDGVYAAGRVATTNTLIFNNNVSLTPVYSGDSILIVKYDFEGNALWASTFTIASNVSLLHSVSAGNNGIAVGGYITNNSTYSLSPAVSVTGTSTTKNFFIAKYDNNGKPLWAKSVTGGPSDSICKAIAYGNNSIYAAGNIKGSLPYDFGNNFIVQGTQTGTNTNAVIIKYDLEGNPQWGRTITSANTNGSTQYDALYYGSDGIYAAGAIYTNNTYNFGNNITATAPASYSNAVLVKYNAQGSAKWASPVKTAAAESMFTSVCGYNDEVYTGGYILGNGHFNFASGTNTDVAGSSLINFNLVAVRYR